MTTGPRSSRGPDTLVNSRKVVVVSRNEFLQRVRTRWFLFTTLLGPVVLVGFVGVVVFASVQASTSGESSVVFVDGTGRLADALSNVEEERIAFTLGTAPEATLRSRVLDGSYSGFLKIPAGVIEGDAQPIYYSLESGLSDLEFRLRRILQRAVRTQRLKDQDVAPEVYEIINAKIVIDTVKLSERGEEPSSTIAYAVVGGSMGFLIYLTMLVYGSVVMQGVIQEKASRVVEIMVSSVSPFQLLMGKILGIGAMGLVQMTFWALLIAGGTGFVGAVVGLMMDQNLLDLPAGTTREDLLAAAHLDVPAIQPDVFVWFVLFFLFGYLLYATMFAAVGAAVEQQQDTQGIILPVMVPIVLSMVFLQPVIQAPNSALAVVLSLIPFTAPVSMVVRVAMIDPPFWSVALSFLLLVGTFLGSVWASARIYRVGILMYGKKTSIRDLVKWARYA